MSRLPVTARGKTWHRMAKLRNHEIITIIAPLSLALNVSNCFVHQICDDLRHSAAPAASARPGAAQPARALWARAFARDSRDSVAIARPPSPGEL